VNLTACFVRDSLVFGADSVLYICSCAYKNLLVIFGLGNRVEVIEHDNTPRKFDIDYLKRVKAIFTRRARHFEKLRKRHLEAA